MCKGQILAKYTRLKVWVLRVLASTSCRPQNRQMRLSLNYLIIQPVCLASRCCPTSRWTVERVVLRGWPFSHLRHRLRLTKYQSGSLYHRPAQHQSTETLERLLLAGLIWSVLLPSQNKLAQWKFLNESFLVSYISFQSLYRRVHSVAVNAGAVHFPPLHIRAP